MGLADSSMCAPAIAARAPGDKICHCFLTSSRCRARVFEEHLQSCQILPSQTRRAQSLNGVNWCCTADSRRKLQDQALSDTTPAVENHVLMFHHGVIFPLEAWALGEFSRLHVHSRQAYTLVTTLTCKCVYGLRSVN